MKKLLTILTLMLVLAVIFCACTKEEQKDPDTTTSQVTDATTEANHDQSSEQTTVSQTETETEADVPTESQSEETTAEDTSIEETTTTEETTTEEVTTNPPIPPIVYDFNSIAPAGVKTYFSNANQTEYVVEKDENDEAYVKLTTSGAVINDPFISFDVAAYARKIKAQVANLDVYKYVMLKVKSVGMTDGSFYMYYGTNKNASITGTQVVNAGYDVDDSEWQYIFFDCSNEENWTGRITTFRFDYTMTAVSAGESLYIAEVKFLADDREYYESLGLDFGDIGFDISKENADKADELLSSVTGPTTSFDNYKGEQAEHEDASLNIWFDHMYDRTANNNNVSTGRLSYQMMLAKNERENCQLILASDNNVEGLKIYISDFTNANGDTLATDLFWGYYFNIEGEKLVEPLVPVIYEKNDKMQDWIAGNNGAGLVITDQQKYNGFDIKGGENQTFIIRVTTLPNTPAGEYSATVRVLDKDGKEVKKVTVFTYVWNFELPEETSCKTLMDLDDFNLFVSYGDWAGVLTNDKGWGLYETYYNFLLENRVCAYDIPGVQYQNGSGVYTDSMMEYVKNPRVVAFQPTGWSKALSADGIKTAYEALSQNPEWLEKAYFYPVDEPGNVGKLNDINYWGSVLKENFPGYKLIVPTHLNAPVSGGDYYSYIDEYVNVWCPHTYFYNTFAEWYADRSLTYRNSPAVDAKLGSFRDRMWQAQSEGEEAWWYVTRFPHDPEITLTINTDAVNYRTLFWQQKLYDVDGFLYYLVNDWSNNSGVWVPDAEQEFLLGLDSHHEVNAEYPYNVYGNGILLYAGVYFGQVDPIGSVRLECVRDGIEDFEYLTMLEEIYGYDVVQAIVHTWTQSLGEYNTDTEAFTALRTQIAMLLENANK